MDHGTDGGTDGGPGRVPLIIVAHRILIGSAILFGLFFTGWEWLAYRRTGEIANLVIAGVTLLITAGMAYYLKHLRRFVG